MYQLGDGPARFHMTASTSPAALGSTLSCTPPCVDLLPHAFGAISGTLTIPVKQEQSHILPLSQAFDTLHPTSFSGFEERLLLVLMVGSCCGATPMAAHPLLHPLLM